MTLIWTPVSSTGDDRAYRVLELSNKLKAVIVSDPNTDRAAASLEVGVGQFQDPIALPGLAHFCEHMLFLGTEKFPDENSYSSFLSSHGGNSNGISYFIIIL
jgi:insulysin